MPNWSYNHLQIIGRKDEVDKCLNSVKTKESAFDFNTVIPEPESNPDWSTWRWEHWGTDRNAFPMLVDSDVIVAKPIPDGVQMSYETAWRPGSAVLVELSKKFPELEFQLYFIIEGNEEGLARFKNGEILYTDYEEVHSKSVDWLLRHETRLYKIYRSLFADPACREWVLMKLGICPINPDGATEDLPAAVEAS
jgi:hypothetical protein